MARRKDRAAAAAVLPGYRDCVEIGGGAFATVYRATAIDTDRPVALKILKVDAVHPHVIETFTREIQALARVSDHPNIVTMYRRLTTPDGRPVLVLEWCRESLAQQVRRDGPLPARAVTSAGIKIAGALETAHRHGFLHRDMKPQNVLVTRFDEPALGDLGVAALQASAQATAGEFGVTALHAAPEMLEGHHPSAATDVYGLASTLYQLLTGSALFAAFDNEAPASVILRIIRDPVPPLRAEGIPIGLSDLLEAALSKDPGQRPGSAVEFADALVAVEAGAGWPRTAYVVWGQGGLASQPAPSTPPSLVPRDATSDSWAGAPSPARGAPPAPPSGAGVGPARAVAPGPAAPAAGREAPSLPIRPAPATAPASPPAHPGPSVAAPAAAPRRVLMPDRTDRDPQPPAQPIPTPTPPDPWRPPPGDAIEPGSRPARPVFVDPPAPSYPPGPTDSAPSRQPESTYGPTVGPHVGEFSGPAGEEAAAGRGEQRPWSPLLIAGLASAALVVVAALLLVLGVL